MPLAAEALQLQPTVGDYVAHFADELIAAPPGTDEHVFAWRGYMLSIVLAGVEQGQTNEPTLNAAYRCALESAAQLRGYKVPEVAQMELNGRGWRYQHRRLMADVCLAQNIPLVQITPVGLLGMLAARTAHYRSIKRQ